MEIEYIGINVDMTGNIISRKTYTFWDENYIGLVPTGVYRQLIPFDYCVRKDKRGEHTSVSAFIKDNFVDVVTQSLSMLNINKVLRLFLQQFSFVSDADRDDHYDPIISYKYEGNKLIGISLYISALRNKEMMNDFLRRADLNFRSDMNCKVFDFISHVVSQRYADLFLVGWDFYSHGRNSYKIYLKIKKLTEMSALLSEKFPQLSVHFKLDGLRFREIAFSFCDGKLMQFNLYYKPQ